MIPTSSPWLKPLRFGLLTALGGLVAALLGEAWHQASMPQAAQLTAFPVDIVFVLDVTLSMQNEIDGVRDGIVRFVQSLKDDKMDVRVACVAFRDRIDKEGQSDEPELIRFTNDPEAFKNNIGKLIARGGGDPDESSLDALATASRQPFRDNCTRVLMLITDAAPHIPDKEMQSISQTSRELKTNGVQQLHLVTEPDDRAKYSQLQNDIPGDFFALVRKEKGGKANPVDFTRLLDQISQKITERTIKGLNSAYGVSAKDNWKVTLSLAVWTGLVGLGIALALTLAQTHYLRRPLFSPSVASGAAVGFFAGLGAGVAGQLLFEMTAASGYEAAARAVSWTALGLLLGWVTSYAIPNLGPLRGSVGGSLGGLLGVLLFLTLASILGNVVARLAGAAALGFCVGLMIGVSEFVFRKAWLEVQFGPLETRTVNWGPEPITIGSQSGCSVLVHGAPALALKYKFQQGAITCEDVSTNITQVVLPGDTRRVGNVTIVLCGAAEAAETVSPKPTQPHEPSTVNYLGPGGSLAGRGGTLANQPTVVVQPVRSGSYRLRLSDGRTLSLLEGLPVMAAEIPGLVPLSGNHVAELNRNPNNPNQLGLRNLSQQTWNIEMPDGSRHEVPPNRSVRLESGVRIDFGPCQGEVVR